MGALLCETLHFLAVLQALKCSVLGDYRCTCESTVELNIGGAWHNRNHCAVRNDMCLLTPTYTSCLSPSAPA